MISLDQVYLLEQKVESAVEKIQQLQAENDALRSKCTELTNALSAKSEQLSSFESDQSQIENGIKKALDRLNSIENSVLKTATQMNQAGQDASIKTQAAAPVQPAQPVAPVQPAAPVQETPAAAPVPENTPSFDTMTNVEEENVPMQDFAPEENIEVEEEPEDTEDDNHDGLGFDIF